MIQILKTNLALIVTAIFIGIIISFVAQFFIISAKEIFYYLYNNPLNIEFNNFDYNFLPLIACMFAATLISFFMKYFKVQRWHGPADSIYAANQKEGALDVKTGMLSTLVSFFSISGGASVGIYGPLVHFGATLGVLLRRLAFMPRIPHDIIIGSGVAAAISAGFGSPIAGIIFAHEVVLRHFSLKAITSIALCSITASFTATQMNLVSPIFRFEEVNFNFADALPGLITIGPASALIALLFMYLLLNMPKISKQIIPKPHFSPFFPAFLCGIIGMFIPEVLGLGIKTITMVITEANLLSFLIVILFVKLLLTSICIGFGLFGGVFSPSLFLGAVVGAIIFHIPFLGIDESVLSIFAVAGMAAVASSVIGAPISAVILVLELTGSYKYAIASIIPVCLSSLITLIFFGSSFFDKQLLARGINMSLGRENIIMSQIKIQDYASQDYLAFNKNAETKFILDSFKQKQVTEGYFIGNENEFLGKIRLIDIIDKKDKISFKYKEKKFIKLKEEHNLIDAIGILSDFVGENVPIVSDKNTLIGVVSEGDVLKLYNQFQQEVRSIEKS